jgi:hypothetical protein
MQVNIVKIVFVYFGYIYIDYFNDYSKNNVRIGDLWSYWFFYKFINIWRRIFCL